MPSTDKYPLPPKVADIDNILCYLDLCYVNPAYNKLKTFPNKDCEPIRSFKKLFPQNLPHFGVKVFNTVSTFRFFK